MTKFEKRINELGFEVGKLSGNLNKDIAEFYQVQKELNELKEELQNADEGDVESLENEIREGEEALLDYDEMIVENVEKYVKNKPSYDEMVKKMAEGRDKKKMAKNQSNATQPQLKPIVNTSTPPALEPIVGTPLAPKEEEKSGLLETLGWGALAILGIFVGIRVFKNK